MDDLAVAIDIGASKIVVAVYQGGKTEIVLNSEGRRSTQFCLAFNKKERLFGVAAEGQFPVNPENTIYGRDVKHVIGLRKRDLENKLSLIANPLQIDGEKDLSFAIDYKNEKHQLFSEHALTMVLRKIKNEMETKITKAVITVPSMFNSSQRFAIKNAVLAAGIEVQSIINDSTATAITYSIDRHGSDDKNILVFDMGATSIDVAVVRLTGNSVEVKACDGSLDIGGESFVLRLVQHFIEEFESEQGVRISDDKKIVARLRMACEKFKKMLSATSEAKYSIESFYQREQYQLQMTRQAFEIICEDLFKQIIKVIKDVLLASNLPKNAINEVIVVGNGGRIPKVEEMISQLFEQKELSKVLNYDESVAIGAAYFGARYMPGASYRVRRLDAKQVTTTPFKVQLGVNGSLILIKKGKLLPINGEASFECISPLNIYFKQGGYTFTGRAISNLSIDILCNIDSDGLVKFILQDMVHTKKRGIVLNHQKPYDAKVEEIQTKEHLFEKHEMEYKKAMEMKNELEKMCLGYRRKVNAKETKDFMNEADITQIRNICQSMLDYLDEATHPEIDDLSETRDKLKALCDTLIEKAKFASEVNHANLLLEQKDYKQANAIYIHCMESFRKYIDEEQHKDLMFKRVSALMGLTNYQESIDLLDSLIRTLDHRDEINLLLAYYRRGYCHYVLRNYPKCLNDLDTVLKQKEDVEVRNLRNKAELEYKSSIVNQVFEEVAKLTKSKKYDQSNVVLQDMLDSKEFVYLASIGMDFRAKAYIIRANNDLKLKNYQRVIEDCEFVEKYGDNHAEIWEIRAESYLELGMLDKAEEDLKSLETVENFNKDRLNDLKRKLEGKRFNDIKSQYDTCIKNKQYQSALNALRQVNVDKLQKDLKLDHFCKQAYALMMLDRNGEGVELCGKALNVDKRHFRAFEIRAECYFKMKDHKKAIDDCDAALKLGPYSFRMRELKRESVKVIEQQKSYFRRIKETFLGAGAPNKEEPSSELEKEVAALTPKHLPDSDSSASQGSWEELHIPNYMKGTKSSESKKVKHTDPKEQPRRSERQKEKIVSYKPSTYEEEMDVQQD